MGGRVPIAARLAAVLGLSVLWLCACDVPRPADRPASGFADRDPPPGVLQLLGGPEAADGSIVDDPDGAFQLLGAAPAPAAWTGRSSRRSALVLAGAPSAPSTAPSAPVLAAGPAADAPGLLSALPVAYAASSSDVAADDPPAPVAGSRPAASLMLLSGPVAVRSPAGDGASPPRFRLDLDQAGIGLLVLLMAAALWTFRRVWLAPRRPAPPAPSAV